MKQIMADPIKKTESKFFSRAFAFLQMTKCGLPKTSLNYYRCKAFNKWNGNQHIISNGQNRRMRVVK